MRSVIIAFAMFSRLPMPAVRWEASSMGFALAALPLVGAALGGAAWLWGWLAATAGLGPFCTGTGFAALSVLFTGGIHMDGLADVADALASRAEPDKARAILKDPHIGGFAAIAVALYLLGFAALASEVQPGALPALALIFVASRALSGLAILRLPAAAHSSLAAMFRGAASGASAAVLCGWLLATVAAWAALLGWAAPAPLVAGLASYALAARAARRLGGMNGDVAGWLIHVSELAMAAGLVAALATGGAL